MKPRQKPGIIDNEEIRHADDRDPQPVSGHAVTGKVKTSTKSELIKVALIAFIGALAGALISSIL